MNLRTIAAAAVLAVAPLTLLPATAHAQANIQPKGDTSTGPGKTFPIEQIITSSVHDAWLLSGKDESTFFDIVQQLAAMSAEKRGITLPDSEAAGRRMGNYIKAQAKLDHDQLLYVVVDKAVRMVGAKSSTTTASAK